jgi:hypothetical protein
MVLVKAQLEILRRTVGESLLLRRTWLNRTAKKVMKLADNDKLDKAVYIWFKQKSKVGVAQ